MPHPAPPPEVPALLSQFKFEHSAQAAAGLTAPPANADMVTVTAPLSPEPLALVQHSASSVSPSPLPSIAAPQTIPTQLLAALLSDRRRSRSVALLAATPAAPSGAGAVPSGAAADAPSDPTPAVGSPELTIPTPPTAAPESNAQPTVPEPASAPAPALPAPSTTPIPPFTPASPMTRLGTEGILELKADRQDYNELRQIFTAEGNVSMRFRGALLTADRLQVNLVNRVTVAEGNVVLTRGDQVLRGQRFDYNFVQEQGTIKQAGGTIFLPSAGNDLSPTLPTDISAGAVANRPVGERIAANQPPQQVSVAGGIQVSVGSQRNESGAQVVPQAGGTVKRLRFEADQIDFYPEGWVAQNVRITNDPFSPPEVELRAKQAQLTRLSPLRDEVVATRPRLVFDQRVALPIFRRRLILDRNTRDPGLINFGFDGNDRGGLFIERKFDVISQGGAQFSVTPQFLVQKVVQGDARNVADYFGLKSKLSANLGPRTSIQGSAVFTSLDFAQIEDNLRASLRAQHLLGTHTLSLEGSYRDRLFNNSLGFQDIQSSVGALLYSPVVPLGKTGINLSYQTGYQFINADTDRLDLLNPVRRNNRISLGRFQSSVALSRGFLLWQGKALPPTAQEGLRYTPTPIVPYVSVGLGLTGVASAYSNGDIQRNLNASVGVSGQFGHFSRPWFDYTAFNLTYSQVAKDGVSPFLFDRVADDKVLFAGITQQIYGPFRLGFQTAYNLETGKEISTDYIVEYSRRTYSVSLRYNPVLSLGSIGLRISDFNWTGGSEPFLGSGVTTVDSGVRR
jgi:Protein of unknown function (DUF3769)